MKIPQSPKLIRAKLDALIDDLNQVPHTDTEALRDALLVLTEIVQAITDQIP